jgi:transaldolase
VEVYRECSARIVESFLPLYRESGGASGFVTLQGDPREEHDAQAIVRFARECRKLGPHVMAKIPVIPAGLDAIEECVAMDMPLCATEVFSLAQAVAVCERYAGAVKRTGKQPPIYVTHITGIFEEYLRKAAARDRTPVPEELIVQAGAAVARRQYRLLRERGYGVTMLGGGARSTSHFTDFVGAEMHITINWSTAAELIGSAPPVEPRIDVETPASVIEQLSAACPDFTRAYNEDGLAPGEFAEYGPVRLFRNMFLEGWYNLLAAVSRRRHTLAL